MSKAALQEKWAPEIERLRATRDTETVLGPLREQRVLGSEDALKLWQLSLQEDDQRRATGVYYTELQEARKLADRALARFETFPQRVLEPSCGGGQLLCALLAAGQTRFGISLESLAKRLHAYDVDSSGIWLAHWRVAEHFGEDVANAIHWQVGDTLEMLGPESPVREDFALIFGNPPFGNAIEASTRRSQAERLRYAGAYPLASRGAFDKCALFVELAAQRCSPNGSIVYILPRSWLAQPASQRLRAQLARDFHVSEIADLPDDSFFDAAVATIALDLQRVLPKASVKATTVRSADGRSRPLLAQTLLREGNWGAALHVFAPELVRVFESMPLLSDQVEFSAGASTEEAYQWVEHLRDLGEADETARSAMDSASNAAAWDGAPVLKSHTECVDEKALVIAGMIDPFRCYWGETPTRYLRQDYARPVLKLSELRATRQERSEQPRALLPTLSLALEAWPDLDGQVVGAVSTISAWVRSTSKLIRRSGASNAAALDVPCPRDQTLLLCAILNSAWCRLHYACLFSALAMAGGNTQVSKNKLAALRVPQAWLELLEAPPCSAANDTMAHPQNFGKATPLAELLKALAMPQPSKGLASLADYAQLQRHASIMAKQTDQQTLRSALLHALQTDPLKALEDGVLDLILFALAPELHSSPHLEVGSTPRENHRAR